MKATPKTKLQLGPQAERLQLERRWQDRVAESFKAKLSWPANRKAGG